MTIAHAQQTGDAALIDRARALHKQVPLIDGHNDYPWALRENVQRDIEKLDIAKPQPTIHTDIARLKAGGVGGQFWSVYTPSDYAGQTAVTATLEQIDIVHQMLRKYPETFELALTAADVERIFKSGKIASMIGMEGGHSIDNSLAALRMFHHLGARYMTLTHSKNTPWADAATDAPQHGGLTPFGEQVVREMNWLGMLVDLSHVSPDTMADAIAVSAAPVIFSHSSARAVNDVPRNVPDNVLQMLPKNGGIVMVTFVPGFLSPKVTAWNALETRRERSPAAAVAERRGRPKVRHRNMAEGQPRSPRDGRRHRQPYRSHQEGRGHRSHRSWWRLRRDHQRARRHGGRLEVPGADGGVAAPRLLGRRGEEDPRAEHPAGDEGGRGRLGKTAEGAWPFGDAFSKVKRIIVAMGDSTTAGTPGWKSRIEAPPDGAGDHTSQYAWWLMQDEPDWEVLNHGVNGERSDQIRERFQRDVLDHKPAAVVIIAGVNDVYQGREAAHVIEQLGAMYDLAEARRDRGRRRVDRALQHRHRRTEQPHAADQRVDPRPRRS